MTTTPRQVETKRDNVEPDDRLNLARRATAFEPGITSSPWTGYEFVRGYAAMVLPFSSGHLLALRAWPQSSFGPYVTVWHQPPDGEWRMYVDGPSLETTCPRYWMESTERAYLADIDVTWTGPTELRIESDDPELSWTMSMIAPASLERVNRINAALPLWTWRNSVFLRLREWLSNRLLDVGEIRLSFTTPSGHDTVIIPEELYGIVDSEAVLDGQSLGEPVSLDENPTIGGVPLPTRPTFTIGQAQLGIPDREEYERTRDTISEEPSAQSIHRVNPPGLVD